MIARFSMLLQIALRNLLASWVTFIIGGLIFGGTVLVVVGGALLDSVNDSMSRSIIGSLAGHLQLYSSESKKPLQIYGGGMGESVELPNLSDFDRIRATVESVPNVRAVVPMGLRDGLVTSGNIIDLTLAKLRGAVKVASERPSPQAQAELAALKDHVRQVVAVLKTDMANARALMDEAMVDPANASAIERASSEEFWRGFDQEPLDALEFLENRIAPQIADGDPLFIRFLGTDLDLFSQVFDRMQIVEGQAVPKGERGMLLAKFVYEENFKLKPARRLDRIKEIVESTNRKIASDPELKRWVTENKTQPREILLQLDALKTQLAIDRLNEALGAKEATLEPLLTQLFDTTDENFAERYALFYGTLAPLLELYRVKVGEELTLTSFTRAGYPEAANVKVWGTFQFRGLEKSPLGGITHLMDLDTFQVLYGALTPERRRELEAIKAQAGVKDVSRESAEAEMFGGGGGASVGEGIATEIDEAKLFAEAAPTTAPEGVRADEGDRQGERVVLNAAVVLKDARHLRGSMTDIERALAAANLKVKVMTWQDAAGLIGQFMFVARAGLYIFIFIIFVVALVVINNAMMMATLQRVREIGTMRAIGAHRGFILTMICTETGVLGLIFGTLGVLAGSGIMIALNRVGIPATAEELYFFFSGPRLHPVVTAANLIPAFVIVLGVALVSTLYPAVIATRVAPVTAMQAEE